MAETSFKTPVHEMTTLDSGVRVLTSTMPHTNAVSIFMLIGTGSRYESDELAGSSHLFEHLLFKGTSKRPTPREISAVVEDVGGALNAFTDREMTGYWCRVPRPYWEDGLDLLTDMALDPLFREDDIKREKQVVFEEIRASHDSPEARSDTMLDELVWPDHPMGREIAGSEESVGAVSREAMLEYMATQYVPSNVVVTVAGGVTHDEVVGQAARLLDGWEDREPLSFSPAQDNMKAPSVRIEHRPTEQAHMSMGLRGISLTDPDRYPLRLLSVALGESMGSRLFEEVREKRGLAYAISSGVVSYLDTGSLNVGSGVDPARATEAVEVIVAELVKIRDGLTADELERAKALSTGRMMLRMEESRAVAMSNGAQELLKGSVETADQIIAAISAVEADEIASVAQRLIRSDRMALSLVGPFEDASEFEKALTF